MMKFLLSVILFCLLGSAIGFVSHVRPFSRFLSHTLSSTAEISEIEDEDIDEKVIVMTPKALHQLRFLQEKQGAELVLRMGVRAGGCSGMSYVMDLITPDKIEEDDHQEINDGFTCVVDPKSPLYLYGLQLDYSDELIGGGFQFTNPNADTSCGCGKSFGV